MDLLASAGLASVALVEERLDLDFDEWFDRGTTGRTKEDVRQVLLAGTARGFAPAPRPDGGVTIRIMRAVVRGVRTG